MFGLISKNLCWIIKSLHNRSFVESLASYFKQPIKCASLNNRPCQALILVGINSNETLLSVYC